MIPVKKCVEGRVSIMHTEKCDLSDQFARKSTCLDLPTENSLGFLSLINKFIISPSDEDLFQVQKHTKETSVDCGTYNERANLLLAVWISKE